MQTHFELPRSLKAAHEGRRLLGQLLDMVPLSVMANALVVLSELVTNSVLHASVESDHPVDVQVRIEEGRLRLSVCDPEGGVDPEIVPSPREEGGWGLLIVDRLSSRWGVTVNDHSCVWAEFDLRRAGSE